MTPSSRRRAPDPVETIRELIGKNRNLKGELAALKTMFDVRKDRHNELIEDKECKILGIGYKLANEISKTERQSEDNAKLSKLFTTAEIRLSTEVFGHAETTSRLKLLEQQKDQLLSRLNVGQERILKFHVSETALKKEKYDLVEQLREAKDLQDSQQVQIDSLKDAAKLSASNIKTLNSQLKDLQSRGSQTPETSRKKHGGRTSMREDLPFNEIEVQS
jgi:chromosome segregation ATPase